MDFSLESISEKIHSGKTKSYFEEVLSSYQNENYRSAVVMLWSVCVCDIIYKLQDLVDIYDDKQAKSILSEMSKIQDEDSKSSSWEVRLIDEVHSKTYLLDNPEYENLRFLQTQRHLSAHPVLKDNRELHRPNKDTVRSLIRNALEDLLTKPPFYARKVFDEILSDLVENHETLDQDKKMVTFLESKYLNRLTTKVRLFVFKDMWKLVFRLENEDCEEYRNINFRALKIIADIPTPELEAFIKDNVDFFSNISGKGTPANLLVLFLSKKEFSNIYSVLNEEAKIKIDHHISSNSPFAMFGWYVKESLKEHFESVIEWLQTNNGPIEHEEDGIWDALEDLVDSEEWQRLFWGIISERYALSGSYNQADFRFEHAIKPFVNEFDLKALEALLQKIETNNQTYGRGASSSDHAVIYRRIIELNAEFDFSDYPHFERTVRRLLKREDD